MAALTLSGCLPEGAGGLALISDEAASTRQGVTAVRVYNGAFKVRAPEGYCVDQTASREETGFVVMAPCGQVSDAQIMPAQLGLITVQVGATASAVVRGSEEALMTLLESPEGGTMLSATGTAAEISVVSTEAHQGVVEVIFDDAGAPPVSGLDRHEYRAFLDIKGRLVTLRLRGYASAPLSRRSGLPLMRAAVQALINANSETVAATSG